jgi:hypothetical protein
MICHMNAQKAAERIRVVSLDLLHDALQRVLITGDRDTVRAVFTSQSDIPGEVGRNGLPTESDCGHSSAVVTA